MTLSDHQRQSMYRAHSDGRVSVCVFVCMYSIFEQYDL